MVDGRRADGRPSSRRRGERRFALAVDVGTSAVKAAVLSSDGGADDAVSGGYPTASPVPGQSEQNPDDWWRGIGEVLSRLLRRHPEITAENTTVALTGQMHTTVLRDEAGQLLRPAILWSDARATAECAALTALEPRWADLTGNVLLPAFTAAHLAWVRAHEPDIFARIHSVSVPKDDVRARLGAGWATEPSDASAMSLMDVRTDRWCEQLLGAIGLDARALPPIVASGDVTGRIAVLPPATAAPTGRGAELDRLLGAPVIGGAGDQAAQAIALGVVAGGRLGLSIGTSGAALQALAEPRTGTFRHAYPGLWLALDSTHSAGLALAWWSRVSGATFDGIEPVSRPAGIGAPMFLPFLQGHRGGRGVPGTLTDLHVSHDATDLTYAVLEGVALEMLRLARCVTGSERGDPARGGTAAGGVRHGGDGLGADWLGADWLGAGEVGIGGRAGQIDALRTIIAAGLGRPVRFAAHGSAFGAAVLAAQSAGWYGEFAARDTTPARVTLPDATLGERVAARLDRYERLLRQWA